MELRWTPSALQELDDAGNPITQDNPRVAAKMGQRILEAVDYSSNTRPWIDPDASVTPPISWYPERPSS